MTDHTINVETTNIEEQTVRVCNECGREVGDNGVRYVADPAAKVGVDSLMRMPNVVFAPPDKQEDHLTELKRQVESEARIVGDEVLDFCSECSEQFGSYRPDDDDVQYYAYVGSTADEMTRVDIDESDLPTRNGESDGIPLGFLAAIGFMTFLVWFVQMGVVPTTVPLLFGMGILLMYGVGRIV